MEVDHMGQTFNAQMNSSLAHQARISQPRSDESKSSNFSLDSKKRKFKEDVPSNHISARNFPYPPTGLSLSHARGINAEPIQDDLAFYLSSEDLYPIFDLNTFNTGDQTVQRNGLDDLELFSTKVSNCGVCGDQFVVGEGVILGHKCITSSKDLKMDEDEKRLKMYVNELNLKSELYCTECILQWISSQIESSNYNIKCPCSQVLKYGVIVNILKSKNISLLEKYETLILNQSLRTFSTNSRCGEKFSRCPRVDCTGGGIGLPTDSYVICCVCQLKFCMNCEEEFHTGYTC